MLGNEPERFQEIECVFMIDEIIDTKRHRYNESSFFRKNARGRFQEAFWPSQVFKHLTHHDCIYLLHIMMIP